MKRGQSGGLTTQDSRTPGVSRSPMPRRGSPMKALITSGLCLTLGLLTARSIAQEVQWRPAASPGPGAGAIRPVGLHHPAAALPADTGPSAPTFRPVGLHRPTPLVRGQAP